MKWEMNFKNKKFKIIALLSLVLLVGLPSYIASTQVKGTRSAVTISGIRVWNAAIHAPSDIAMGDYSVSFKSGNNETFDKITLSSKAQVGTQYIASGTFYYGDYVNSSKSKRVIKSQYGAVGYQWGYLTCMPGAGGTGMLPAGDCTYLDNSLAAYSYMDFGDSSTITTSKTYSCATLTNWFKKCSYDSLFKDWILNNTYEASTTQSCYYNPVTGEYSWGTFYDNIGSIPFETQGFMDCPTSGSSGGGSSTPSSYTITYDANGGSVATGVASGSAWGTSGKITVTAGNTIGTIPTPTRTGYRFDGWYTDASGGTYVDDSYEPSSSITIFAHWTRITYTVTYNANGGTVSPTTATVNSGDAIGALPTPTRTGYRFDGWYTDASGGTLVGAAGVSYTPSSSITIFAHWTRITYTVTYNANGGTVSPTTATVNSGDAIGALPTPTRSGYTFDGWYTAASGGTLVGAAGVSYTPSSSITIFAHWTRITYTVTYNANGGTVSPTTATVNSGDAIVSLPSPTRSGYRFKGWYTAASGGDLVGDAGVSYTPSSSITIYAHWNDLITITYNANGGTVNPASKEIEKGEELGTLPTPNRQDYTFLGWYAAAVGGSTITPSYKPSSSITIYAHWKDPIIVTYNINTSDPKAKIERTSDNVQEGGSLSSFPEPNREGYIFMGWYTAASGGTAINAPFKPTKAITLYAHWEEQKNGTYVITYNANGGEKAPENTVYLKGDSGSITLTYPRRTGWKFTGWNTKADGSGDDPARGSTVKDTNLTLYAQWEKVDQESICGVRRNPETSDKEIVVIVMLVMSIVGYLYSYFIMKKAKQ